MKRKMQSRLSKYYPAQVGTQEHFAKMERKDLKSY